MQLSIIILNYRKPELTILCIESLYKIYLEKFEKDEFEVIIVDNFSEDNSIELFRRKFKKEKYKNLKIIENNKNTGFGAGNNLGATHTKGKFLLFLNNDTVVKSGIQEMLEYMQEHDYVGICGGALRNYDHSPQSSVGSFFTVPTTIALLFGLQRFGLIDKNPQKVTQVDWVKGALFMIRKAIFDEVNGFDEKIFMYTEDMELCYRAYKKGYRIFFYPDAEIYHQDQGSSNRTFAIVNIYQNILYFYSKHRNSVEYSLVKAALVIKAIFAITIGTIFRKGYLTRTYGEALRSIT